MIKVSRKLALALAAAAAIPATFAIAATVQHAAWHQMTPETRARLDEGRLAMIKTALKLSSDQEKLWVPVEAQVRDNGHEVGVAGALAVAIDRALHLGRASTHGGQGVGCATVAVVVRVHGNGRFGERCD